MVIMAAAGAAKVVAATGTVATVNKNVNSWGNDGHHGSAAGAAKVVAAVGTVVDSCNGGQDNSWGGKGGGRSWHSKGRQEPSWGGNGGHHDRSHSDMHHSTAL